MAAWTLALLLAALLPWATAPVAMAALTLYSCPERTAQRPGTDSSSDSGSSSTSKRGLECASGLGDQAAASREAGGSRWSMLPRRFTTPDESSIDGSLQRFRESLHKRANYPEGAHANQPAAKCGSTWVPSNHSDPDSVKINLFYKCYTSTASTGQLWMLQGGPGITSAVLETSMLSVYNKAEGTFDVCTVDFRGVHRSNDWNCWGKQARTTPSPAGCEYDIAELQDCIAELHDGMVDPTLFSSEQAAHDLQHLIQTYDNTKTKKAVYGVSYGTMWLAGLLKIDPNIADAYIFDSIASPYGTDVYSFYHWDRNFDDTITRLLQRCSADSMCSGKLSSDAVTYAHNVLDSVYGGGHCDKIKTLLPTRVAVGDLMATMLSSPYSRPLIPALFYRLKRCEQYDVDAIQWLLDEVTPAETEYCDNTFSQAAYFQIATAEMYDTTVTSAQATNASNLPFTQNGAKLMYDARQKWSPAYQDDFLRNVTTTTTKPVLILSGEFDAQTPTRYALSFASQFSGNVRFGFVANGFHSVLGTAYDRTGAEAEDLAGGIIANFIRNPSGSLDLSPLNRTTTYEFAGSEGGNTLYFGTSDAYDGRPPGDPLEATPFIIALACVSAAFLISIGVIIYLCCLLRRADKEAEMYGMRSMAR